MRPEVKVTDITEDGTEYTLIELFCGETRYAISHRKSTIETSTMNRVSAMTASIVARAVARHYEDKIINAAPSHRE